MRRTALAMAVVMVVLAACTSADGEDAGSTGDAPASSPSPGEVIVFTRQVPGSQSDALYSIEPAGSNERELVTNCCPHVSSDGSMVVVHAYFDEDPWVLPAVLHVDGSGYTVLDSADPTLNLAPGPWSPDGERIAASGFEDFKSRIDRNGIYILTSEGEDLVRVTQSSDRGDRPIAFSPDGTRILFYRPVKPGGGESDPMDLYSVRTDGGRLFRLNPPGTTSGFPTVGPSASWSPDHRRVAFVASSDSFWEESPRAVFVAEPGEEAHRITPWSNDILFSAQWSPDGQWIAFAKRVDDSTDVFVAHPDGSGLKAVTTSADGSFSYGPVWSPDGAQLLFIRGSLADPTRVSGQDITLADLWVANVDGSDLRQLTHQPAEYEQYAWAP
jgi:Tol biopolymer transport system component